MVLVLVLVLVLVVVGVEERLETATGSIGGRVRCVFSLYFPASFPCFISLLHFPASFSCFFLFFSPSSLFGRLLLSSPALPFIRDIFFS